MSESKVQGLREGNESERVERLLVPEEKEKRRGGGMKLS